MLRVIQQADQVVQEAAAMVIMEQLELDPGEPVIHLLLRLFRAMLVVLVIMSAA
jgi:hypothetical protein